MQVHSVSAIIIDDEPPAQNILKSLLCEFPEIREINCYTDPVAGFEALQNKKPDILFLDMQMPGISGLEIMKMIETFDLHVHVIIVTGYEQMVLKAAHYGMIDYLLKPVCKDDLSKSLNRYFRHAENHHNEKGIIKFNRFLEKKIRIPTSFEEIFFAPEEIIYIEADGNYTNIYLSDEQKVISSYHLGKIQELLPAGQFIRISRKHIINFNYLHKVDRKTKKCHLKNNGKLAELPFSKSLLRQSRLITE
jgi:two-component system, LytTR family, response regulator